MPDKIYSIQPRFKLTGQSQAGWAIVDGIFKLDQGIPEPGSMFRDAYLARMWMDEPILAGVFGTFVERASSAGWKVIGGKIVTPMQARILRHGS